MEQNDPQFDGLKDASVAHRLLVLRNHAEEIRRNNEIARRHELEDEKIRDSLASDQAAATDILAVEKISSDERAARYHDLLQEYADTRGLEDLADILEKASLLIPGTPFIPREMDNPAPRIVADDPDAVQFVLRVSPGEDLITPGLRVLTTEGEQITIGLRDEVGRDIIKSRLDSMTRGRNTTPTNKELRQCIGYYKLIDDMDGVEYCKSLLARRKAARIVESHHP